jgi:hypothetical protein
MKKYFTLASALVIFTVHAPGVLAQNVGIGTTNPSQKLDVAGNINLTGTIMANGTSGSNGQVLTSTGSGLSWSTAGSGMGYRKAIAFYTAGAGTWTVPAGVTEVMAELWGGGSGGSTNLGGTSGGYARMIQTVTPGNVLSFTIGQGSAGSGLNTTLAGNTSMTFSGFNLTAYGGGGVTSGTKGTANGGSFPNTASNGFTMPGNAGESNIHSYGMKNSTTYVETIVWGRGGAPVGMLNPYPVTGDVQRTENGVVMYKTLGGNAVIPSAGGAAGAPSGYKGGDGMVVFWYN